MKKETRICSSGGLPLQQLTCISNYPSERKAV